MKKVIFDSKGVFGLKSGIKGFYFKKIFVTDPYVDETGRFDVNPREYYGLTNKQLEILAKD